jgi:tyrosine-protein kinase Etk/Wzc
MDHAISTLAESSAGELRSADLSAESEISLAEVAAVLGRHKRLIASVTLCAMALTAVTVLIIPASYTAETVILPPQPDQSSAMLMMGPLAAAGGLSGLAGASLAGGLWRNPADVYVGILRSRTIADALIKKFSLKQLYECKTLVAARKKLAHHTEITARKDSLIHISVDDHDGSRAAAMANAYVDQLHEQTSRLAITSASQRRLFFEQQLASEKDALANAEVALKDMEQTSGLVFPSGQSEALMRSIAALRAEIASREVQLQSVRLYATSDNPQLRMLESSLAALRVQLNKLEAGNGVEDGTVIPARKLPAAGLEYLRKFRDLKYHEMLYELLAKQYEAARIDEAKLAPVVQVVDSAVSPDQKSWPPRMLLTLGSGLIAIVATCLFLLIRDYRRRAKAAA